jgi:hypothetical protein
MNRDLCARDYVYVWLDGIHTGVRLGSDRRLCSVVMIGARLDGTKGLVALSDGYGESEESWAELLRDLKKRGMRAPELAVGEGALGFWNAIRDVFPQTRSQRDWVHKSSNVLDSMPKSSTQERRRPSRRSPVPRTSSTLRQPSRRSPPSFRRSGRRRSQRSSMSGKPCSPSTSSPPNTGATCAPPTR